MKSTAATPVDRLSPAAARSPQLRQKDALDIANCSNRLARIALAKRPDLMDFPFALAVLVDDSNKEVRIAVARNDRTLPPEIAKTLLLDKHRNVRAIYAMRSDLSDGHRMQLANDPDYLPRMKIAERAVLPVSIIRKLVKDDNGHVVFAIARHPDLDTQSMQSLADEPNACFRETLALRAELPHSIVAQLKADTDDRVLAAINKTYPGESK